MKRRPAAPRISAVVHTLNEAHHIRACLASLDFADEVVVVDNESTDATVSLARAAGARVETYRGRHGYPEPARVYGLTRLRGDWVFILDADERATPELGAELKRLAADPAAADGYEIPIKNFHFGRWLRHGGLYPDLHLRFFRRARGGYPEVGLHRGIRVTGRTAVLTHPILHYSYRDLEHYFEKFDRYTTVEAERIVASGRRPTGYALAVKPLHRFAKSYLFGGGWLDGLPGLFFHVFSAAYVFASEVKAWDLWRQRGETLPVGRTLLRRK